MLRMENENNEYKIITLRIIVVPLIYPEGLGLA